MKDDNVRLVETVRELYRRHTPPPGFSARVINSIDTPRPVYRVPVYQAAGILLLLGIAFFYVSRTVPDLGSETRKYSGISSYDIDKLSRIDYFLPARKDIGPIPPLHRISTYAISISSLNQSCPYKPSPGEISC